MSWIIIYWLDREILEISLDSPRQVTFDLFGPASPALTPATIWHRPRYTGWAWEQASAPQFCLTAFPITDCLLVPATRCISTYIPLVQSLLNFHGLSPHLDLSSVSFLPSLAVPCPSYLSIYPPPDPFLLFYIFSISLPFHSLSCLFSEWLFSWDVYLRTCLLSACWSGLVFASLLVLIVWFP